MRLCLAIIAMLLAGAVLAPTMNKYAEQPSVAKVSIDLAKCTPPHVRVTPQVELTFNVFPDGNMTTVGCTRFHDKTPIKTDSIITRSAWWHK